jgi:hypothetical protein
MSKHETPMTRWYWRTVNKRKGLLIEEFAAVKKDRSNGKNKRHIDGVIVLGLEAGRRGPQKGDRELVGQVVVSSKLLEGLGADVLKSVGICKEDDKVLHEVLKTFDKCEAVVYRRVKSRKK